MKRTNFSTLKSCLLLFNLFAVVIFFSLTAKSQNVSDTPQSFPGKSQRMSEIRKNPTGYFPDQLWHIEGHKGNVKSFMQSFFSQYLTAGKEKSLIISTDKDIEIYRFLRIAWRQKDFVIRLEKHTDKIKLFATEFRKEDLPRILSKNPAFGEAVLKTKEQDVSLKNFTEFVSLLEKSDYWKMPINDMNDRGNDGSEWLLESVRENRYHIVNRWSPTGDFREACVYLLKLSGIEDN